MFHLFLLADAIWIALFPVTAIAVLIYTLINWIKDKRRNKK